jgi:ATPase subunit of ABC transporter with duplicated ATPase domains
LEAQRLRKQLFVERERLAAEADSRRRVVEGSGNRLSKRQIDRKDNDGRGKINLARLSGKDRTGADQYKSMENRLARLDEKIKNTSVPVRRKQGITTEGADVKMDRLCLIPAGTLALGGGRSLSFPELLICPGDRIALTGANGTGKSTLTRHVLALLPQDTVVLYIPQEIDAESGRVLLEALEQETEKDRGEILSRFSRLGSDPWLLLQSRQPSPGEIRKLLIARGVFTNPAIIIMDEPTNHLDLSSIRLLEKTLAEVSCALLLVSHDEAFLSALTSQEWAIDKSCESLSVHGGTVPGPLRYP